MFDADDTPPRESATAERRMRSRGSFQKPWQRHALLIMRVGTRRFQFAVGIATIIGTLGFAAAYVALHDWLGRGDLIAMMTWSLPLACAVAELMTALSARVPRASATLAFALFVPSGAILGGLWTLLVAVVVGSWILAFSFPVLWCWVAGGFLGGLAAA